MMGVKNKFMLVDARFAKGLGLIVDIKDHFTGSKPVSDIQIVLENHTVKTVKNLSGYYLFFKVPVGTFHIRFESEYYFTFEENVTIPAPVAGTEHPVKTVTLQPKPCYPFPSGTTLIRGMVTDAQGNYLAGASIEGAKVSAVTTSRGEFACYYKGLTEEDVVLKNGKRYLKGVEGIISLHAVYDSLTGGRELANVAVGEVRVLDLPIVLT
jgi:hypothetical protein